MTPKLTVDPALLEYCTPRQKLILESIIETGSAKETARRLGFHRAYPSDVLNDIKRKAAKRGYSPDHSMTRTVPAGYAVKGVSTYYDADGVARGQWVKSSLDAEAQEAFRKAALEAMCAEIAPVAPIAGPSDTVSRLVTLYTFTDYHVGMLAWHREGGADWDLKIAESVGTKAMSALVAGAPKSKRAIVNIQGDFMHFDGHSPVTPTHGHILDADGRFGKVVDVAIRLIRQLVGIALQHHDQVELLIVEGNHDVASSLWLRKMFSVLYENEPRITVNDSELPYYVIQHGETMLAFHHGHLKKNDQLPILFAAQYPAMWGATRKRYCHTGHRHHTEEKEHSGMTVVQHPTLAARDAYASRGGWISERSATAITYDLTHGKVGSNTVCPEMFA